MDDKLGHRLREDAARINVEVSDELDDRIRASLENVTQERRAAPERRDGLFPLWWASSLTGVGVAVVVIVLINLNRVATETADETLADLPQMPTEAIGETPGFRPQLKIDPAFLTASLEQELENLEADLKKAEDAVRADMGLDR